jgi:hypothetical protein
VAECTLLGVSEQVNSGDKGTDCCIAPSHISFFTREFLTKSNMTVVTTHPPSLFRRLKTNLKGRHFDTTEVMETESQAVLNTLTEHDFQDAFKNDRSDGNGA